MGWLRALALSGTVGLLDYSIFLEGFEPESRLIDLINERFGENLNEADQLFFDQITEAATKVDAIRQAAENNPIGKFQLVFGEILESLFIERMDLNENLFARYMNEAEFRELVSQWLEQCVYKQLPKSLTCFDKPKAQNVILRHIRWALWRKNWKGPLAAETSVSLLRRLG